MKLRGSAVGFNVDYPSRLASFTFLSNDVNGISKLMNELDSHDVDIEITKHAEQRSKKANSYFHILCDKLADCMKVPKGRMKNYLLFEYGQRLRDEDGNEVYMVVPESSLNWWLSNEQVHAWSVGSDGENCKLVVLRHSAELSKDEFKVLIDGTIADCKECGVETLTPDEYARMMASLEER